MKRIRRLKGANSTGQAVIEYILILLVVLSLIFGFMYQFNRGFRAYLDAYFGNYLACLLETGELPLIGNIDASASQCTKPTLKIGELTPYTGEPASYPASNARASGGGTPAGNAEAVLSSGGSGPNGSFASRAAQGRPQFQSIPPRGSGDSEKDKDGGFGITYTFAGAYSGGKSGTPKVSQVLNYGDFSIVGNQQEQGQKAQSILPGRAEALRGKPKTFVFEPPAKKPKLSDDANTELNIGGILKWAFIILIIILIALVIGGQVASISKSWEKS